MVFVLVRKQLKDFYDKVPIMIWTT